MRRSEVVRLAKIRALELLEKGHARLAYEAIVEDFELHPETRRMMGLLSVVGLQALNDGDAALREWIEGFAE